jgi:hypothetical protein
VPTAQAMLTECGFTAHPGIPLGKKRPAIEKLEQETFRLRYNTAAIVMDIRGKVILDIFRCRDLQDKRQSISNTSYGLLLSTGGSLTWR